MSCFNLFILSSSLINNVVLILSREHGFVKLFHTLVFIRSYKWALVILERDAHRQVRITATCILICFKGPDAAS